MATDETYDVAILGAGIIGLSLAWKLKEAGHKTVLLDRQKPLQEASSVAAGMLAPVTEAHIQEPQLLTLGITSSQLYPSFIERIERYSDSSCNYLRCGTLLLARDRDDREELEREFEVRKQFGLTVERLLPSQIVEQESGLSPSLRFALKIDSDHSIDPVALGRNLLAAYQKLGGELRDNFELGALTHKGAACTGLTSSDGQQIKAKQTVIALGAWAGSLQSQQLAATLAPAVRPVKGQIINLIDRNGPGLLNRVIRGLECYITPRGDGRYALGASVQEQAFDRSLQAGAVFELLRGAYELLPGVTELEIEGLQVGFRPGTPDNLPMLGPDSQLEGLTWVGGHYRNGILLAPITAEIVTDALTNQHWPKALEPFDPARLQHSQTALN